MIDVQPIFIIAAEQPKELAEFYRRICGGVISRGFHSDHYSITYNQPFKIEIFKPNRNRNVLKQKKSSCAICFQKASSPKPFNEIQKWSTEMIKFGAVLVDGPHEEKFGAEAWMSDPEGNQFLIFIPNR